jgi:hypothetical protein
MHGRSVRCPLALGRGISTSLEAGAVLAAASRVRREYYPADAVQMREDCFTKRERALADQSSSVAESVLPSLVPAYLPAKVDCTASN